MQCASCFLLLRALWVGRDGETYIGDLHSQAAVTYRNYAPFRPTDIPRMARHTSRAAPCATRNGTATDNRSAADRAVSTTRWAQEHGPRDDRGTRRTGRAGARDRSPRRARRHRGTPPVTREHLARRRGLGAALRAVRLSGRRRGGKGSRRAPARARSEEHTSELQSLRHLV